MPDILGILDPEQLRRMAVDFTPKVIAALLVLLVFWLLVKVTRPTLRAVLRRARFAEALVKLLVDNVYRFTVLTVGLVMAASQLGIDVGAALAGIGVAGLALGFAAQDSLSNTIAGFLIFWDKPFEVGQFITTEDKYGKVTNITMRTTRIRTPDNVYVVIPNRELIENVLVNHSMYGETRVNVPIGIAYKESIARAREVLLAAARSTEGVSEDHAPDVVVQECGDSSVNLMVRVWVADAADERPVFFRTLENCKVALDEAGIEIPFPHLQLFVEDVRRRVWDDVARLPSLLSGKGGGDHNGKEGRAADSG